MLQEAESALPGAAAGTEGREEKMELPRSSFFFSLPMAFWPMALKGKQWGREERKGS